MSVRFEWSRPDLRRVAGGGGALWGAEGRSDALGSGIRAVASRGPAELPAPAAPRGHGEKSAVRKRRARRRWSLVRRPSFQSCEQVLLVTGHPMVLGQQREWPETIPSDKFSLHTCQRRQQGVKGYEKFSPGLEHMCVFIRDWHLKENSYLAKTSDHFEK